MHPIFIFEKALMREHFNESYIESDLYPKAVFEGNIINFDPDLEGEQTRFIKGEFSMHGVTKSLEIKAKITKQKTNYTINGNFQAEVEDYNIKIPALLKGNIAKTISVDFNFQYESYDN